LLWENNMPQKFPDTDPLTNMAVLIRSFQLAKMLQVAANLDLADRIGESPRPIAELARECGADSAMLLRMCRALAAFGIFAVNAKGHIAHNARSAQLRRDAKPTLHYAARYWTMPSNWTAWSKLEDTIRTGQPAFELAYGMANFEYLKRHPHEAELFDAFMQHSPDDRHAAVVEAYDFAHAHLIVDVGGGSGALLAAILAGNLNAKGLLFDRENVIPRAQIDRCAIEAGDFFERVPAGGDIYTLSQILHDWSDERASRILANCRAAMRAHARLLVIERVLDEVPGRTNPLNFLSDMDMMVLFPGAKERTLKEFAQLFRSAGFSAPRLIPTRSPFFLLESSLSP
jgi:O-methyltransferase